MGAGAGTDLSFINMVVMKDSFEVGLRMLSDMARRPAFAPDEIERQRQQMLSGLQVSLRGSRSSSPTPCSTGWSTASIRTACRRPARQRRSPRITRDDLVAFHRRNFVPNNAILAVVGDVTAEEAFDGVTKVFGDWERREIPAEAVDDAARSDAPHRRSSTSPTRCRPRCASATSACGATTPTTCRSTSRSRILGGEGANRLHQVLRTERGLTYGAQADMDTLRESGAFEASTNTRSEATGEVLRLMVDEFWRLQRERVGERELADAKAYMTGSFPLTIETPDAIATQVLNVLFYGLPVEQLQSFRERVNAVTVDDVERVARFYLRPDRLSIVLVGNAAAFMPQLRRLGFGAFEVDRDGQPRSDDAGLQEGGRCARAGVRAGGGSRPGRAGPRQASAPGALRRGA